MRRDDGVGGMMGCGATVWLAGSLFANASNQARANLLIKGAPGLFVMLYTLATLDDVNAKNKTK